MRYNPDIHHRKSIRLKDYDYSKEGMYFITICTKDREYILGNITNVGAPAHRCPYKEQTNYNCKDYKFFKNDYIKKNWLFNLAT